MRAVVNPFQTGQPEKIVKPEANRLSDSLFRALCDGTKYDYDNLGRTTRITQEGVAGGNSVAEKRVDLVYNEWGELDETLRYADLAGDDLVVLTDSLFDDIGRLASLSHSKDSTVFADYDYTWDDAHRITAIDYDFDGGAYDDDAAYTYDDTNQVEGATYTTQTDETYDYDSNGNRDTGYTTGDHNRLTSDGTYTFVYDNEGNMTSKTKTSDSTSVHYEWDHRNRMTTVTFKNSGGTPTKIVEYAYDHGQRWIRKTLDSNADSTVDSQNVFVHDHGQIVLDYEKSGTGDLAASDVANRHIWGASVDDLIASEAIDDGGPEDVNWALTDHLRSVRDIVVYNVGFDTTSLVKHIAYDSFGKVVADSAPAITSLFLYTGRPFDSDTGIQNNLYRPYDPETARWMSEDPAGFLARDANLYRYTWNRPITYVDPNGMAGWDAWNTGANQYDPATGILTTGTYGVDAPAGHNPGDQRWGDDQDQRVHTDDSNYDRAFSMSFDFRFASVYTKVTSNGTELKSPGFYGNSGIYIYNAVEVNIFDTTAFLDNEVPHITGYDSDGNILSSSWPDDKAQGISQLLSGVPYDIKNYLPYSSWGLVGRLVLGPDPVMQLAMLNRLHPWVYDPTTEEWVWNGPASSAEASLPKEEQGWNSMEIGWDPRFDDIDNKRTLVCAHLTTHVNGGLTFQGELNDATKGSLKKKAGDELDMFAGGRINDVDHFKYAWTIYIQSHHGSKVQFRNMNID